MSWFIADSHIVSFPQPAITFSHDLLQYTQGPKWSNGDWIEEVTRGKINK